MGHPRYEVTEGSITFQGEDVFELEPDERAKLGMFLAFQYPSEVPGVSVANFLRTAINSVREEELSPMEMYRLLQEKMSIMQMDPKFAERYLNEGFSGGEKKGMRSCRCSCSTPNSPSWTRLTRAWTLTPCRSWRRVSTR
jgi:Fe-S cluster assembly ATP-binding protein